MSAAPTSGNSGISHTCARKYSAGIMSLAPVCPLLDHHGTCLLSFRAKRGISLFRRQKRERFLASLGMTKINCVRRACLFSPLEQIHLVAKQCFPIAEKRDDDSQADRRFRRRIGDDEDGENVPLRG